MELKAPDEIHHDLTQEEKRIQNKIEWLWNTSSEQEAIKWESYEEGASP